MKSAGKARISVGKSILKPNAISALQCPGVDGGCEGYGRRELDSDYCKKCLELI